MSIIDLVLTILAILALLWCLITIHIGSTPFQCAAMRVRWLRWFNYGKAFHFFISYKSEDAVLARQLTERFIACGLTPWFAEYAISIPERNRFQQAIDSGVENSRFGICLTNEKYFKSKYCEDERKGLLENCGVDRVIELNIDPTYKTPQEMPWAASLTHCTIQQSFKDVTELAGFRLDPLGETVESVRQNTHMRTVFPGITGTYSLDLSQWEVIPREELYAGGGDLWGPKFRRWCDSDLIWGHLIIGPQPAHVRRKPMLKGAFDDRKYYEDALEFADMFFNNELPQRCVGAHLFFLGGWSQVAFTTFHLKNTVWSRMYSLVFPGVGGREDIEFAFFFFMREPFRHFCHRAYLMDELVMSLELT